MGKVDFTGSKYIYKDQNTESVLLDCGQFLENKSRIPMHCTQSDKKLTIPILIDRMLEKAANSQTIALPIAIIDILLTAQLMKTAQPVRILEYGSVQGQVSRHLAEIIGEFNEKSSLVCFHNTIDLEWMEQMADVKTLPQLSFLAGDFGKIQLQEKYFDIVLVNGLANFTEPYEVLSDVLRMAKDGGVVLCYCDRSPFLKHVFQLIFDHTDVYEVTPYQTVMQASAKDYGWVKDENEEKRKQILATLALADALLAEKTQNRQNVADMVRQLQQSLQTAKEIGRPDLKIKLLERKEKLISESFESDASAASK